MWSWYSVLHLHDHSAFCIPLCSSCQLPLSLKSYSYILGTAGKSQSICIPSITCMLRTWPVTVIWAISAEGPTQSKDAEAVTSSWSPSAKGPPKLKTSRLEMPKTDSAREPASLLSSVAWSPKPVCCHREHALSKR